MKHIKKLKEIIFVVLIQIVFITLKLLGIINWAWIFVVLPILIGMFTFIIIFFFMVIVMYKDYQN